MVLVVVGSARYSFTRLLSAVDKLAMVGILNDVFAQVGDSRYNANHFRTAPYIPRSELERLVNAADFVICHAGVGIVSMCLAANKKTVVVPRRRECGELVDDHQIQFAAYLHKKNRTLVVQDIDDLEQIIRKVPTFIPTFKETDDSRQMLRVLTGFLSISGRQHRRASRSRCCRPSLHL